MIFPIVAYGDPVLKREADEIVKGEFDVKQLAEQMFDTMYNASGVGLAAPQIGKSIRMFVIDAEGFDEEECKGFKKVFINPEILEESEEEWAFEEGCLSIPGVREDVWRPEWIKVNYFDEDWKEHTIELDGINARVFQHEYDHIDGILFTDHINGLKKRLNQKRLLNISKGKVDVDYRMKFPSK
jgi:peptide deformylase